MNLTLTRYTHAHHVPHAEHVQRSDEMVKHSRDDVEDFEDVSGTSCCPLPVLFTAQRAKLSRVFNGQNYPLAATWFSLPLASFQPVYASSPLLCSLPTTMPCCSLPIPFAGRQRAK